jgi:biopolymer transport protein ExbB
VTIDWMAFVFSSPALVVLLLCSILSVVFILERGVYYWLNIKNPAQFVLNVKQTIAAKDLPGAIRLCEENPSPVSRVILAALQNAHETLENLNILLSSLIKQEELNLERFLAILGTLGNTAPFIGLFGTVVGIIKAFQSLNAAATATPNIVAGGIAEALIATAAGLFVAIPAVVFYNFYLSKVRKTVTDLEAAVEQVLFLLKSAPSRGKRRA